MDLSRTFVAGAATCTALALTLIATPRGTEERGDAPATVQSPPTVARPDPRAEDLVDMAFGQQYQWPSAIKVTVAPPTLRKTTDPGQPGGATAMAVRTTVINNGTTPYDISSLLGPTAQYGDRSVGRTRDSRYPLPGTVSVIQPGQETTFETMFPAEGGHVVLQYRAGFQYEAVAFHDSATPRQ